MRPGWEPWIQKNKNTNSKKLNLVKVFSKEEKNGMGQGRNLKLRTTLKNNTSANHDSLISGMVHVKILRVDGHLQAKERGLRRNQYCWHLDLGFPASRTVRKLIYTVQGSQLVISVLAALEDG